MNILLHSCCAPCANQCVDVLRGAGDDVTLFWYNPNIHPSTEYRARRDALRTYAQNCDIPLAEAGGYALRPFLAEVMENLENRCVKCYKMRMAAAAEHAVKNGFDGFTTSLLISPYQDHGGIRKVAEEVAEQYGVPFVYHDFRLHFRAGQKAARAMGLYMQKYCGCIFSEEERYTDKAKT